MLLTVFVDGLCEPRNPGGTATYGFVVYRDGERLVERAEVVGEGRGMSNNVAEYSALCAALEWLLEQKLEAEEIAIRSDSQLLVNQMGGAWECHGGMYTSKYHEALGLVRGFRRISYRWIPREDNTEADSLSRKAYEEHGRTRKDSGEWCYKSTALKEFGLSDNQISCAIRDRLVELKKVPNPHNPKTSALLLHRGSLTENLEEIKAYPKTGTKARARIKTKTEPKETCLSCRWVRYSGPHIGCFPNGKYALWVPKNYAHGHSPQCKSYEKRHEEVT